MAKPNPVTEADALFQPDSEDLVALLDQKEALELKIKARRAEQRESALRQIQTLLTVHGFQPSDLFPNLTMKTRGPRSGPGSSVGSGPAPAVYRDPISGKTWSGRGRIPSWIKDVSDRSPFRINPSE